jgi:hypothetical protein
MKTLTASLVLVLAATHARAQQASPTMDKLQAAAAGAPGVVTFDAAVAKPSVQAVDASTPPASAVGGDDFIVATPVVNVKPKQVVFSQWAANEGGKIGAKWGGIAGFLGGGLTTGLLLGLTSINPFLAIGIGLAIFAAGIVGGWLLGRHLGNEKAKELQGSK